MRYMLIMLPISPPVLQAPRERPAPHQLWLGLQGLQAPLAIPEPLDLHLLWQDLQVRQAPQARPRQ